MKILIISTFQRESAPVFSYGLASGLRNANNYVCAMVSEDMDNIDEWKQEFNDNNLFCVNDFRARKRKIHYLLQLIKTICFYRKVKFDYIILTFPTRREMLVAKLLRHKNICTFVHDLIPHSSTVKQVAKNESSIFKKADVLIVLTRKYIEAASTKYNRPVNKVVFIRHPMPMYPQATSLEKKSIDYTINFLFFGRIEGYKGLDILARAYRKLETKYNNMCLTVAGNGDFSPYSQEYSLLKNVNIINRYIDDSEIPELFCVNNTVVVLPYIDATQSGVIPMAFYYGVPVIASNTGGLKEQLFDGTIGSFFEPGDIDSLFESMESYIRDGKKICEQKRLMEEYAGMLEWDYVAKDLAKQLETIKMNE